MNIRFVAVAICFFLSATASVSAISKTCESVVTGHTEDGRPIYGCRANPPPRAPSARDYLGMGLFDRWYGSSGSILNQSLNNTPSSATSERNGQVDTEDQLTDCPVSIQSGEKYLHYTDYEGYGEFPLTVKRNYNNRDLTHGYELLGSYWSTNFDNGLKIKYQDGTFCLSDLKGNTYTDLYAPSQPCNHSKSVASVVLMTENKSIEFVPPAFGYNHLRLAGNRRSPSYVQRISSLNRWRYFDGESLFITFDGNGRPLYKENLNGIRWNFQYASNGYLDKVVHSSGRKLNFVWQSTSEVDSSGIRKIKKIQIPNGEYILYNQEQKTSGRRYLETVDFPGNTGLLKYQYGQSGNIEKLYVDGVLRGEYEYDSTLTRVSRSGATNGVNEKTFIYNDQHTKVTNAKNHTVDYYYNEDGRLETVSRNYRQVCPAASKTIVYKSNIDRTDIDYKVDWAGVRTSYKYYDNGNIKVKYRAGITHEKEWDSWGRLTKLKVWDGALYSDMCAPSDPCPSPRSLPSKVIEYEYGIYGENRRRVKKVSSKALDAFGNVYLPERVTTFKYEFQITGSLIKKVTIDGPKPGTSDVITIDHNSFGEISSKIDGSGNKVTYKYDGTNGGAPSEVVDPNNNITYLDYDLRGRIKKIDRPNSNGRRLVVVYQYYGDNQLKRVDFPGEGFNQYFLDPAGRLDRIERPSDVYPGELTQFYYDDLNNVTQKKESIKTSSGSSWGAFYHFDKIFDADGNLEVLTGRGQEPRVYTLSYTASKKIKTVGDGGGSLYRYEYDHYDRLKSITNGEGEVTKYSYDGLGNLKRVVDGKGNSTIYYRNGYGEIQKRSSPDTGMTDYEYNQLGKVESKVDDNGTSISYGYNELGRVSSVYAAGPYKNESITYHYNSEPQSAAINCENGKGRLCGFEDSSGSTFFSYTDAGKVKKTAIKINNDNYTLQKSYDGEGRLRTITLPNDDQIVYSYDVNGRIEKLEARVNGQWKEIIYNAEWRRTNQYLKYGNGLVTKRYFDVDNRIRMIETSNSVQSIDYDFESDDGGRVSIIKNNINPDSNMELNYDDAHRLESVLDNEHPYYPKYYGYDDNGNREQDRRSSNGHNYYYNDSDMGNRLAGLGPAPTAIDTSFGYDGIGSVKTISTDDNLKVIDYDSLGRLIKYSIKSPDGGLNYASEIYRYNALNQRVHESGPDGPNNYIYSSNGKLLMEVRKQYQSDRVTFYVWFGDLLVGVIRNGTVYYVHSDHLGRPEVVTNEDKDVVWRANLKAFDREVSTSTSEFGELNLGFPGQYYDRFSGLWYNQNRYYDGSLGRYLQSDPVGLRGGMNTYAYANSSPGVYIDPNGLTALQYDQSSGSLTVDPQNGQSTYKLSASSGRDGSTDQTARNEGPIPTGEYTGNSEDLTDPGALGDLLRNTQGDWGDWRMPLKPSDGTNTFGRDGFFLHGGSGDGSAGCIDVGGGTFGSDKTDRLRDDILNDPDGIIPIKVVP